MSYSSSATREVEASITPEIAKTIWQYDPETGILQRFHRRRQVWLRINCAATEYCGLRLSRSRVIYFLMMGHWPVENIFFQNKDTRWSNQTKSVASLHRRKAGPHRNGSSKYRGVCRPAARVNMDRPFAAQIGVGKKVLRLGFYATEEEAARAWDAKARELWGDDIHQNFPEAQ